jgi:hypothetical protein
MEERLSGADKSDVPITTTTADIKSSNNNNNNNNKGKFILLSTPASSSGDSNGNRSIVTIQIKWLDRSTFLAKMFESDSVLDLKKEMLRNLVALNCQVISYAHKIVRSYIHTYIHTCIGTRICLHKQCMRTHTSICMKTFIYIIYYIQYIQTSDLQYVLNNVIHTYIQRHGHNRVVFFYPPFLNK